MAASIHINHTLSNRHRFRRTGLTPRPNSRTPTGPQAETRKMPLNTPQSCHGRGRSLLDRSRPRPCAREECCVLWGFGALRWHGGNGALVGKAKACFTKNDTILLFRFGGLESKVPDGSQLDRIPRAAKVRPGCLPLALMVHGRSAACCSSLSSTFAGGTLNELLVRWRTFYLAGCFSGTE